MTHISTSTAQKWALWLTGLGVAIATVLMLAPMPDMPQAPKSTDKLAHVVMFFGLCLPAVLTGLAPWGWVVAGMGAFGLAIETLQPFVGRQFDLVDLAANLVGCIIAVALAPVLRRLWARVVRPSAG